MKIQELRIGNWVLLTVSNGKEQVSGYVEITSIMPDSVCFGDGIKCDLQFIEPIHINEKVLEACGFETKDDNPKQKPHYEGDILVWIAGFEFTNSTNHNTMHERGFYSYQINDGETTISYLHQLQNLFYCLTQAELEIDIEKLREAVK